MGKKKKKKKKKPTKFDYMKYKRDTITKGDIPDNYNVWLGKQAFK